MGFETIWHIVQQLADEKRIELLNKLQAELEAQKLIKPRMDNDQLQAYMPPPISDRSGSKKLLVSREDLLKWDEEEFEDGEDLDENLTDEEFVEMLKPF